MYKTQKNIFFETLNWQLFIHQSNRYFISVLNCITLTNQKVWAFALKIDNRYFITTSEQSTEYLHSPSPHRIEALQTRCWLNCVPHQQRDRISWPTARQALPLNRRFRGSSYRQNGEINEKKKKQCKQCTLNYLRISLSFGK